jgi:hypothetical protein
LQATAVHFHHGQLRGRPTRRRLFTLGKGPGQPGRRGGVSFLLTLLAHALGQTLDLLDVNAHTRQDPQVLAGTLEGRVVAAGIDDLLEQGGAGTIQVNAQAFGLREKKPCDSDRNRRQVLANRRCLGWSGRCVARGPAPGGACRN